MLAFAALGSTQNFLEAYGVRARPSRGAAPAGIAGAFTGFDAVDPGRGAARDPAPEPVPGRPRRLPSWPWVNRVTVAATVVVVVATGTPLGVVGADFSGSHPPPPCCCRGAVALGRRRWVLLLCAVLSIGGAIRRTGRARAPQRQQLLLLLVTSALVSCWSRCLPGWPCDVGLVPVPVAVAVGVLRYRLLGVEVIVRRILLFGLLTRLVVAVYAGDTAASRPSCPSRRAPGRAAAALALLLCRCGTGCKPGWTGWSTAPGGTRSVRSARSARRSRRYGRSAALRGRRGRRAVSAASSRSSIPTGPFWRRPGPCARTRASPSRSPSRATRSASW